MGALIAMLPVVFMNIALKVFSATVMQKAVEIVIIGLMDKAVTMSTNEVDDKLLAVVKEALTTNKDVNQ